MGGGIGLLFATLVAGISSLMGNRTAVALLVSLAASIVMNAADVPATWWRLFIPDVLVILAVARRNMTRADVFILALFPSCWFAYAGENPYDWCLGAVTVQLLLTMPWPWLQKGVWSVSHGSIKGASCVGGE